MSTPAVNADARIKLREKIVAAVEAEMARVGPDAIKPAAIARQFTGKSASMATLFRWIAAAVPGARAKLAREIRIAAMERADRMPDPAADAAREAADLVPVVTVADVAGTGSVIAFVEKLQECFRAADDLMAHAKTPDGKIRNARLLLAGSEHARRLLETAAKLRDGLRQERDLDNLMAAIVAEVAQESPACAERILRRMTGVLTVQGL